MAHIELSRGADAIVVAPATADFIAKLAHGLADDLLDHAVPGAQLPAAGGAGDEPRDVGEPGHRSATSRSLRDDGVTLLGPDSGDQACGEIGTGRMLEPEEIVEETIAFFAPKLLAGRRVLITAGPTFEADRSGARHHQPVLRKDGLRDRARAAATPAPRSRMVAGPTSLATPRGVARIDVRTAREMHDAVDRRARERHAHRRVRRRRRGRRLAGRRRPARRSSRRRDDGTPPALAFAQNPDILATRRRARRRAVLRRLRRRERGPAPQRPGQARAQGRAAAGRQHRPRDLRHATTTNCCSSTRKGSRELARADKQCRRARWSRRSRAGCDAERAQAPDARQNARRPR